MSQVIRTGKIAVILMRGAAGDECLRMRTLRRVATNCATAMEAQGWQRDRSDV